MKKELKILIIAGAVVVTIIFFSQFWNKQTEDWTLSLYNKGQTYLRLNYRTKEDCFIAAKNYSQFDRFDCGYKCEKKIDLSQGILCEKVCNTSECR